jgi:hypothetical protein
MTLDIDHLKDDMKPVLLVDPEMYVTGPWEKVTARQEVFNNMLGTKDFHPLARADSGRKKYPRNAEFVQSCFSDHTKQRVKSFIRLQEVRTTFKLEDEETKVKEIRKWLAILENLGNLKLHTKDEILEAVASIIPEHNTKSWRDHETFIGSHKTEKIGYTKELVHHIGAKKDDLNASMGWFLTTMEACINFASGDFSSPHPSSNKPTQTSNGWVLPFSVATLYDYQQKGLKKRMLYHQSEAVLAGTRYRFRGKEMVIWNSTKRLYACWDAFGTVEFVDRGL